MFDREGLLQELGDSHSSSIKPAFSRFAYVSPTMLKRLAALAMDETWGNEEYALGIYIAVNVRWSIEQGLLVSDDQHFYVTAGHLTDRYGKRIYLVFKRNGMTAPQKSGERPSPYALVGCAPASRLRSVPDLPLPPEIPKPPERKIGAEIVIQDDHILVDRVNRIAMLDKAPLVAKKCAVAGSIQWSLYRGLAWPYWYFGNMQLLVPMYLSTSEYTTRAPDLVAPLEVDGPGLLVRTVLEPYMPYPKARVAATRPDALPPWMLDAWKNYASSNRPRHGEDPEG